MLTLGTPQPELPVKELPQSCAALVENNMKALSEKLLEESVRNFGEFKEDETLQSEIRLLGAYSALQQLLPMVRQIEGLVRNAALSDKEAAVNAAMNGRAPERE